MPEFENLEPYLDQKRQGRVIPVAPQNQPAQDFRPGRHAGPARQSSGRLRPKAVELDPSVLLSTEQMERAYKNAVRSEKRRANRGKLSLLERLKQSFRKLFSGKAESPKPPPGDTRPRRSRSSKAKSATASPRSDQSDHASRTEAPQRKSRSGRRSSRGRRNRSGAGGPSRDHQKTNQRPAADKSTPGERAQEGRAGGKRSRSRRSRRNRGNPPPSSPPSSQRQKPSEN